MKRFLVAIALCGAACFAAQASSTKIDGYISDSKCAAAHNSAAPDAACVQGCIKGGKAPVFVDDAEKQVWTIDNPAAVKDHYGHHVAIVATVDEANKSVHISKVKMLK